jgi:hypothetical protein
MISRTGPRAAAAVVARLGAVQAQEFGAAKWGLGLRMPRGATDAAVARAVDAGRILRTHVLRPTWHFVTPRDIRWMLELTAPQVHRRMAPYDRQLELDADVKVRAADVFERALRDGEFLTRAELGVHLERARLPSAGSRLVHLAMYAELEGVICSGPRRGKQSTYGLVALRAPHARRLPRDQALAELAARFFRSHGPATVRDFVWWSGLKTADATRAIAMIRARRLDVEGLTYWSLGASPRVRPPNHRIDLLPIYDEYLVAYRDRVAVPHPGHTFGTFVHAVLVDGQVAGTWRPRVTRGRVDIDVRTARRLKPAQRTALERAIGRYRRFLVG